MRDVFRRQAALPLQAAGLRLAPGLQQRNGEGRTLDAHENAAPEDGAQVIFADSE